MHHYKHAWEKGLFIPTMSHSIDGNENSQIATLRANELANPAPFSHRTLLEIHSGFKKGIDFQVPDSFTPVQGDFEIEYKDVPIDRILGVGNAGNFDNYSPGMTFREVLFHCLHGGGLVQESLDFLASNLCKDAEMPHTPIKEFPKTRSKRGLEISQHGEWYVIDNGHQRGIFAMYHIWQLGGLAIKNVRVCRFGSQGA